MFLSRQHWGRGEGLREASCVETDPRAEVPLAGLSCPANAAGNNVTSVSLAVNPGAPQLGFIWIFVLGELVGPAGAGGRCGCKVSFVSALRGWG